MYCYTTSISHGVEKYFPRLCCTGISDAIFFTMRYSLWWDVQNGLKVRWNVANLFPFFNSLEITTEIAKQDAEFQEAKDGLENQIKEVTVI